MSKLPRTNVIDRQEAVAIAETIAAEVTSDELETVQGGATAGEGAKIRPRPWGPFDRLPMYGFPRPFPQKPIVWDRIKPSSVSKHKFTDPRCLLERN